MKIGRTSTYVGIAVGVLLMIGLMVLAVTYGSRGHAGIGQYQPGVGVEVEAQSSRSHFGDSVTVAEASPEGYSVPPTSGRHWSRWAECGFHRTPVPDERIVHNLEHGQIVVHYNLPTAARVQELDDTLAAVEDFGRWGLARPYDAVPADTVWMTAWGVMDGPLGVGEWEDGARFGQFFDAYSGVMGPEFPNGSPC